MTGEYTKEVAFNIGVSQSVFVAEIYKKIFTSYLAGDVSTWYNNLSCMQEILYPDLEQNEVLPLKNKQRVIAIARQKMNSSRTKEDYVLNRNKVFELIMDYQRLVLKYFKKYGYLPSKKDRSKLSW